jgi:1,4-alpha-glucan branching enzyme
MPGALPSGTIDAIVEGRHADPFAVLGPHDVDGKVVVRAFVPGADTVAVVTRGGDLIAHLARRHGAGFFEGEVPHRLPPACREPAGRVDRR